MFTLHAFAGSIATSSTPAYLNVTPIADPIATVSGNMLYVGGLTNLLGAVVLSPNIQRAKLESPGILNLVPFAVTPIVASALPTATMRPELQVGSPIKLITNEALQAYAYQATSGSASQTDIGIILADGPLAPVSGDIVHARATFTSSATADTWENGSITFDTVLPAGTYDVVGARVEGAHLKFFRLVFQGTSSVRPGGPAVLGSTGQDMKLMRNGGMGTWGTFDQFTPPSVDHITDGTSETGVIFLDLIKKS